MCRHRAAWMCWCTVVSLATGAWAAATSEPAATSRPAAAVKATDEHVGTVKGTNVYVRSGFSPNYYAVTKLNRGDEVKVLREEYGWLEIVPPAGTYSLIDKTYVDRVEDKSGVVNQATWTYAGSNLDDSQRYAKQVKLSKGDKVRVLGETKDGALYKIEPASGATLWIKADFVDRTGMAIVRDEPKKPVLEPVKPGSLKLTEAGEQPAPTVAPAAAKTARVLPVTNPEPKDSKFQLQINAIEAEIAAETAKPLGERNLDQIIAKLDPIAAQTEDPVSQIYAKTRIEQLRGHLDLVGAVRQIRTLHDSAIENANQIARERDKIRVQPASPMDDVVLRGEIRVSGIYTGTLNIPRRWRVVDRSNAKTLAYIEVPDGSPIDPVQYYGKYVGIRATGFRQLKDTIPPTPVYTVQEILVLDPASGQPTAMAGPTPRAVAVPSSQPAAPAPTTQPESAKQ